MGSSAVNITRHTASSRDFSRDGCRTDADVRYRQQMLGNIADGLRTGHVLIGHRVWVLEPQTPLAP